MILGTGIDIVEIKRIEQALERWGESFINRVYSPEEIEYASKHKNSAQHFAGRFAAKEAVFKAVNHLISAPTSFQNISITNQPNGQPVCRFNHIDFKYQILLSISHCHTYAVASAVVTQKS